MYKESAPASCNHQQWLVDKIHIACCIKIHQVEQTAHGVPVAEFKKLTKIPIVIYYGDNIPETPMDNPGQDQWRIRLEMAKLWAAAVNRHGGDASVVHLPEIGMHGNTHFPFSDLNNFKIADLMYTFLENKQLN